MIKLAQGNLRNPLLKHSFTNWINKNLLDSDHYERISWQDEIDQDLTLDENKKLVRKLYPTLFDDHRDQKIKKLVIVEHLIPKLKRGEVKCTYRRNRLSGLYYVVKDRFSSPAPLLFIEALDVEKVDPHSLSNQDAQVAGIMSAKELLTLLEKWYGTSLPTIYRNWFTVKALL